MFKKSQANELKARYDLLKSFKQDGLTVDDWYNSVQKHLFLYEYPVENTSILSRDIFLFSLQDEEFFAKCMSQATTSRSTAKIRQMGKKLENRKTTAKHMRNQPKGQLQMHINQLKYQNINLPLHKKG